MLNRMGWVLVIVPLTLGMMFAGCASAPGSFTRGSGGDTSILLRQDLNFNDAFREVIFVLNRNGFDPEMVQPDAGYVRTRWRHTWNERGRNTEWYRVRIICSFNPNRTQLILRAEAEFRQRGRWVQGYDTRAVETLRNDLTMTVGR